MFSVLGFQDIRVQSLVRSGMGYCLKCHYYILLERSLKYDILVAKERSRISGLGFRGSGFTYELLSKLLVLICALITPMVVPYMIPYIAP